MFEAALSPVTNPIQSTFIPEEYAPQTRFTTVSSSTHAPSRTAAPEAVLLGLVRALPHSDSSMDIEPATLPFGLTIV